MLIAWDSSSNMIRLILAEMRLSVFAAQPFLRKKELRSMVKLRANSNQRKLTAWHYAAYTSPRYSLFQLIQSCPSASIEI